MLLLALTKSVDSGHSKKICSLSNFELKPNIESEFFFFFFNMSMNILLFLKFNIRQNTQIHVKGDCNCKRTDWPAAVRVT